MECDLAVRKSITLVCIFPFSQVILKSSGKAGRNALVGALTLLSEDPALAHLPPGVGIDSYEPFFPEHTPCTLLVVYKTSEWTVKATLPTAFQYSPPCWCACWIG